MNLFKKKQSEEKVVLVVDDVSAIRAIVMEVFNKANGYRAIEARNGEEALEIAKRVEPDMLIMDVNMPKKTGIEVLAELREDERFKDTPVIMLTSDTDRDTILKAASFQIKDFILKDSLENVTAKLQKHL